MLRLIIIGFIYIAQSTLCMSQCDLVITYDAAGNRVFRGNPCSPDCSLHVTSNQEAGPESIREAIFCAEDGDAITIDPTLNQAVIDLDIGRLHIDKSVTINVGTNPYTPTPIRLRATTNDLVLSVAAGKAVHVKAADMIGRNGYTAGNPRILHNEGSLILEDLDLVDDAALEGSAPTMINQGPLTIEGIVKLIYVFYN